MSEWYEFDCGSCPAAFRVDTAVRTEIAAEGCIRCGTVPTRAAFTRLPEPPLAVP